jgi:hypothetical protein
MIYFELYQKTMIDRYLIASAKSPNIIYDHAYNQMRKALGKKIKTVVPFGIRPYGKLREKHILELEAHDAELYFMVIPMKGTLFQVLHARRAGVITALKGKFE